MHRIGSPKARRYQFPTISISCRSLRPVYGGERRQTIRWRRSRRSLAVAFRLYQASDAKLRFIRSLDAAMDAEDEPQLMILEQENVITYACR